MEGVRILASEEVAVAWAAWSWSSFWIAFGIIAAVAVIVGLVAWLSETDILYGLFMFGGILLFGGVLGGILFGINFTPATEYETQYKVIIDENVSFKDFYEHYEVIDQEGEIFIVREKTND